MQRPLDVCMCGRDFVPMFQADPYLMMRRSYICFMRFSSTRRIL